MSVLRWSVKTFSRVPVIIVICLFVILFLSRYGLDLDIKSTLSRNSAMTVTISDKDYKRSSVAPEFSTVIPEKEGDGASVRNSSVVRWTYKCEKNACIRKEATEFEFMTAFEVCWLSCGTHGPVWPYPRKHKIIPDPDSVKFYPENLQLVSIQAQSESVRQLIIDAFGIKQEFFKQLINRKRDESKQTQSSWSFYNLFRSEQSPQVQVNVEIMTNQTDEIFRLNTDEAYEIIIEAKAQAENVQINVKISGSTFFGVRHGIETFSQLVANDDIHGCLQIVRSYHAHDRPHFPYRGILIDSGRNFIPLKIVKRVVDGMAFNKLNILHMHLSDSNSFPFHSKQVPQMTEYGTFSPDQIYYADELKDLVKYARLRGVKIIPELDAPSHSGNGWQFGKKYGLGDLAFYINAYDSTWKFTCGQPPCGILNPINNNTYDVLQRLYADLLEVFDADLFHQGGDEINLDSWASQKELHPWLKNKNTMDLWKRFQTEAFKRLRMASTNVTAIMWSSHLTSESDIDKVLNPENYIIQVWDSVNSGSAKKLLDKGYSIIISFVDKLYLDWGCGTWLGKNHVWKYLPWQNQYDVNKMLPRHSSSWINKSRRQILGAEAPLWGEKVSPHELETKLWPRAAALGESFWSNPLSRDGEVYTRINYHNYRLQQRGIPTSQLQPESCLRYNGHCENPVDIL